MDLSGLISIDIEIAELRVNQCEESGEPLAQRESNNNSSLAWHVPEDNDMEVFHGSHKCHRSNMMVNISISLSHTLTFATSPSFAV